MQLPDLAFLCFPFVALGLFVRLEPMVAALATCLGGWLLLPASYTGTPPVDGQLAYWVIGQALPADVLIAKAWVAPTVALAGLLAFAPRLWRSLRPAAPDALVLLWCLWPLLQASRGLDTGAHALLVTAYLGGSWGSGWLLGRLCASAPAGRLLLIRAIIGGGMACLPFAVLEAAQGPVFHAWVYGSHPMLADGIERYIGTRPVGFFEDGNQYGLWVAMSALAASWWALASVSSGGDRRVGGLPRRAWTMAAVCLVAMTLAAQSVGAILLLAIGLAGLQCSRWISPRRLTLSVIVSLSLLGGVYLSGKVPLQHLATDTAIGRKAVDVIRATGRGSFAWRIAQDQKTLHRAFAKPVTGSAQWDWWRPEGRRPWGMPLMLVGQFGLVGLMSAFGLLLWPVARAGLAQGRGSAWVPQALPMALATIVLMSVLDMLLNTFVFFPAWLCAGALASPERDGRQPGRPR